MGEIAWSDLTVGVAAIVGLIVVVRTIRALVREQMEFMYSHHAEITQALISTARSLEALTKVIEDVAEESRQYHAAAAH